METTDKECCPEFNPEPWDGKILDWDNKKFIKGRVLTLFYIPLNFGSVIKKLNGKAENNGASVPDWICLSEHTSKWNMDIYLAVDRNIEGTEIISFSGKYLCKIYEGNFSNTGKWSVDFKNYAREIGLSIDKLYMWYTTCPKCSKIYGKNYVAILGKINTAH